MRRTGALGDTARVYNRLKSLELVLRSGLDGNTTLPPSCWIIDAHPLLINYGSQTATRLGLDQGSGPISRTPTDLSDAQSVDEYNVDP